MGGDKHLKGYAQLSLCNSFFNASNTSKIMRFVYQMSWDTKVYCIFGMYSKLN